MENRPDLLIIPLDKPKTWWYWSRYPLIIMCVLSAFSYFFDRNNLPSTFAICLCLLPVVLAIKFVTAKSKYFFYAAVIFYAIFAKLFLIPVATRLIERLVA